MGQLGKALRFEILARDGFRCQYCGATPTDGALLQVDHRKPRARGGTDEHDNLTTACQDCNYGKSDRILTRRASGGFQLSRDRRKVRVARNARQEPEAPTHQLQCWEVDSLDEVDEGNQLALVWCATHRKYEWHNLNRDHIGQSVTITRRGTPSLI